MAIIAIGDFKSGNTKQWRSIQCGSGGTLQIQTTHVRQGTHACHFKINPGDSAWNNTTGRRSKVGMLLENKDRVGAHSPSIFYAFSLRLAKNFPNPNAWLFISEWHSNQSTGMGPPLGLFYTQKGELMIRRQLNPVGNRIDHPLLSSMQKEVWHDFVFEVRWRCDNSGILRVWHKLANEKDYGPPKINAPNVQTAQWYNNRCQTIYSMLGLYRAASASGTYEMWGDGYVMATTFEEAANHAHGVSLSEAPKEEPEQPKESPQGKTEGEDGFDISAIRGRRILRSTPRRR